MSFARKPVIISWIPRMGEHESGRSARQSSVRLGEFPLRCGPTIGKVATGPVARGDERRHPAGGQRWWGESWGFEFALPDASLGGFVRHTVYPRRNIAWFWAAIVGEGRSYVLCRDHDLTPPVDPNVIEVRGGSLWSHAICEAPLEHWTVAMEAYAVEFEDRSEAWRQERGDRIGLAFDLEWESLASAAVWAHSDAGMVRYELPCEVHGDLQMGDESWTIAGAGWRHHEWGLLDWNGSVVRGERSNVSGARPRTAHVGVDGAVVAAGSAPLVGDWVPGSPAGRYRVADAPLLVDRPDGFSVPLLRSLDRVVSDGVPSPGWSERLLAD